MPRIKPGKKSTKTDVNGEHINNSENGVEKEKKHVDNGNKVDSNDTNSVDSKSSGTSIKKRFSFAKRKKNSDNSKNKTNQDNHGVGLNGDLRRTNSLNNITQDGARSSKIPILKPKRNHNDNKLGSKHELCPRSQKTGFCESRSLVLNPGMDSWRMAGLMDTVSNTYSTQTLSSVNSVSDNSNKPPNIALCSGLSEDYRKKAREKVENGEASNCTSENSPITIITENIEPTQTVLNHDDVLVNNHSLSRLPEDEEVEDVYTNNCPLPDIQVPEDKENTDEASSGDTPFTTHKEPTHSTPIIVLNDSVTNEPVNTEEVNEDTFCAGVRPEGYTSSNNDCSVEPPSPDTNESPPLTNGTVNGGIDRASVEESYTLDDDNIISIRKLRDLIIENEIQMPKEVCCDDWLVLDISHSAIVSS